MKLRDITGAVLVSLLFVAGGVVILQLQLLEPVVATTSARKADASYIIQGPSFAAAKTAVTAVGGTLQHELGIIKAVSAALTSEQYTQLQQRPGLRVYANEIARVQGWGRWGKSDTHTWRHKSKAEAGMRGKRFYRHYGHVNTDDLEVQEFEVTQALDTQYPRQTGALEAHIQGITGAGVTVAILDSGIAKTSWLGGVRLKAEYDATLDSLDRTRAADENGHGSHVTSIIISQGQTGLGEYNSMAPGADFVSVKAFDENGMGTYADVINGLSWIMHNQALYNIRVVNLSFGTPPTSAYWDDPLAQAVMLAWQQGLVIVASAGNAGPEPMTIGVPCNVPYVITVGAITDSYTPYDDSDDTLVSFSSAGPTFEGHMKPDVVAYGGHMLGVMSSAVTVAINHPEFQAENSDNYYLMSGTSQAAAVVSGAVALMLQAEPSLTNDDVKCRLMSTAKSSAGHELYNYTVFQQGAGLVDVQNAIRSNMKNCANSAFDLALDISGANHFIGPARLNEAGEFYVDGVNENMKGTTWDGSYIHGVDYKWNNGYMWHNGFMWNNAYMWNNSSVAVAGINSWVEQE